MDTVGEIDIAADIVGDGESVPDTDDDSDCVPQGDAVKVTDTVPHALPEPDDNIVVEPDGLTDPLLRLDNDEQ